jgi:hypothetical protein
MHLLKFEFKFNETTFYSNYIYCYKYVFTYLYKDFYIIYYAIKPVI